MGSDGPDPSSSGDITKEYHMTFVDCPNGGQCGNRKHDPSSAQYKKCLSDAHKTGSAPSSLAPQHFNLQPTSAPALPNLDDIEPGDAVSILPQQSGLESTLYIARYEGEDSDLVSTNYAHDLYLDFHLVKAGIIDEEDGHEKAARLIDAYSELIGNFYADRYDLHDITDADGTHYTATSERDYDISEGIENIISNEADEIARLTNEEDPGTFGAQYPWEYLAQEIKRREQGVNAAALANVWALTGKSSMDDGDLGEDDIDRVRTAFNDFYQHAIDEWLLDGEEDIEQVGHDFMLSAMRSGAGFEDRTDMYRDAETRKRLQAIAHEADDMEDFIPSGIDPDDLYN